MGFGFVHLMSEKKSKSQVFAARLFSTLLLWAAVTGMFLSDSPWAFAGFMVLLGAAASREYYAMAKTANFPCLYKWGFITSALYLLGVGFILASEGSAALGKVSVISGAAVAFVVISSFIIQLKDPIVGEKSLVSVAATTIGFLYIAFLFGFMARLCFIEPSIDGGVPGKWLIIWMVAVTKFTDMGAYITGSLIGKHKMIPHVSPGKTWEGFFGALVWAQLAACGLYALLPEVALSILGGWHHVVILGFILALLAVVGDLAESIIKRCLNAKDSGKTLPGIGGALDLIDSLCFTAPALYFYILWVIQ
ncbi:MAG: phosphatidate cytidylyltransferase [Cryomorphaceae bacterium]|jgi:phosphatidate cytidylyltransferase